MMGISFYEAATTMWVCTLFFCVFAFVSREKEKKVFDASQFSSAAFFLLLKKKKSRKFSIICDRKFVTAENL